MATYDPQQFPALAAFLGNQPAPAQRNWLTAGVSSGVDQLQALGGRAIQAVGDVVGSQGVSDFGAGIAQRNFAEAAANGRPDLEQRPSLENWTQYPAWLGYKTAQQLPNVAASLIAARLGGKAFAGAVSEDAAAFGASVPKMLGGGGLRAGMTAAEAEAAKQAGARWVAGLASQAPVMYPQAVGSMYDEALQGGGGGRKDALAAMALGVPYSVAEGFSPVALESALAKGLAGNLARRVATSAAVNAATETVTEGVQTAMEQSFRPDLSLRDKFSNIVEGAVTGGAIGAVFGSVGGVRALKTADPAATPNDKLKQAVDQELAPNKGSTVDPSALVTEPGGQVGMAGLDPRRASRPYQNLKDEELQSRLGVLQQQTREASPTSDDYTAQSDFAQLFGAPPPASRPNPAAAAEMDLLRREMDIRQGVPVGEPAPDLTAGAGVNISNFPVTPAGEGFERTVQGPFRSEPTFNPQPRVDELAALNERINNGTATAQDFARVRLLSEGPVTADTSANAGLGTDRANAGPNDLFRNQNIALDTQLTPEAAKRQAEAAQRFTDEQLAQRAEAADKFFGTTTAQWAQDAKASDWQDETDLAATVLEEIDRRDNSPRPRPITGSLKTKAVELGVMTEDGAPRDLRAELREADAKNNKLMQEARDKGTQQALAAAAKFQRETLKPLMAQIARLDAIKERQAQRAAAAAGAPAQTDAQEAPTPETLLGIDRSKSQTAADVEVLNSAPPVAPRPTQQQQFAARSSGTPQPGVAAVVEAPVNTSPARDASGTQYQTLAERFATRGTAPTQTRSAPQAMQPSQGTSFSPAGVATNPNTEMQVVTAQDVAARKRKRSRKKVDVAPPVIPSSPLATGTSVGAANVQAAQEVAENRARTQARLQAVVNDASLDEIGQKALRERAAKALAAHVEGAEGSEREAAQVLGAHMNATGGTVFSTRSASERLPPMDSEKLDKALERIASKLPQSAKDAIVLVQTAADLPAEVLEAADARGMHPTDIRGVLYDGKAYVVEDQIGSEAELNEVIQHEVFGHGGTRALFGDKRVKMLSNIWQQMGGLEGLRALARKFGVESALNEYLPGRDLTDADKVSLTDELLAQVQGSKGKFGLMLRAFASQFKDALIRTLRAIGLNTMADRLEPFSANDLAFTLTQMRKAVNVGNSLKGQGVEFLRTTPQGMGESLRNISLTADNVWSWVNKAQQSETRLKLNQFHLYTSTISNIVSMYSKMFTKTVDGKTVNPLKTFWDAHVMRGVAEQRVAHAVANSYTNFEAVLRSVPEAESILNELMQYTFYMTDPQKTFADQPWLHDAKDPVRHAANKARADEANKLFRSLSEGNNESGNKIVGVYRSFIDTNEGTHFAQQAMSLYNLLTTNKEISQQMKDTIAKRGNPMDEYLQNTAAYNDSKASRDFWAAQTKWYVEQAETYLKDQAELANRVDKPSADKIEKNTSALKSRLRSIASEQAAMRQAPYFHLGRFGDWVLTFPIRMKDGAADPAAMEAIAARFKKAGIEGIEIPKDATRGNAFIRFETKAKRDAALEVARELAKGGFVLNEGDRTIKHFNRADDQKNGKFDISTMPQWAQGLMDKIRAKEFGKVEGLSDDEKRLVSRLNNEFERHVEQYFLDLLPDMSVTKVMVQRNNVPGFSSDMMRSHFFRAQIAGRALANLYAAGMMSEARAGLLEQAMDARSELDTTKSQIKQNVVSELFLRDAQRPHLEQNTWVDVARALNHAYFLGMTPAYPVVNMTQIGVLLWPELSKKHGFVNSAKAIAKVTPTAFKVMQAVWGEAMKGGLKNLPDASINGEVLKRAGLSEAQSNFIMRIVNSGILDIGSQSREIGRIAEGQRFSRMDAGLRWAASFGYYSEMLSRLIAALSARELHGGTNENPDLFKYVDDTVRQSMLSYETWNQARATGKMGLAGPYTPIMTSLMQYTFQLTEKLYREFHDGFMDSSLKPEEKTAARKFLAAHLAAIVTLTGTLGMPMASTFAMAFDALANSLWKDKDEEPMDIKRAYRNWLSGVFGDTVGDMIARGVPRAGGYGVDLSARAGEQDLLPYLHMFSKLLTDKRQWKDKVEEDTFRTLGAPVSMMNNIISGGSQFMNGNYMDGLIEMMPPAIKGPMKAYKMTSEGYVDQKGNKIPIMTPGAMDVLWQAMGFNPANNAEYQESKNDQRILRGQMSAKAQQIRENLAVAIENGDMQSAQEYLQQARQFDAKNPRFAIMPTFKGVLSSRARERQQSLQTGAPLGTKVGLADRTAYGISN